jgi:flagellar hook-associated protein 2
MAGGFSVGGLLSGLDSNGIISALIQIERQPIFRIEDRISELEAQRDAVNGLRSTLTTLTDRFKDFDLLDLFSQFKSETSDDTILTSQLSGEAPVLGGFEIDVLQLAGATVATSSSFLGAAINAGAALDSSGISEDIDAGSFSINGVSFNVDPTTDSLTDVLNDINGSSAGVTATYDAVSDTVSIANTAVSTDIINFGASDDDSNFLSVINVLGATQTTNGGGSTEVTSTRNLGAVNPGIELNAASFAGGAATSGSFFINGVSISVDATSDSLSDVVARINDSDAGVTAAYDTASDSIRVVADTLGSRTINFTSGTSNFLDITNLTAATQVAGEDAQFTVNGGAVETRNTNDITDVVGGVTVTLESIGTATLTVANDDESVVEDLTAFVDAFNAAISDIDNLTSQDGALASDFSIRSIQSFLRAEIFAQVSGAGGTFESLVDIGIDTGDSFDATAGFQLTLDEEAFLEALREDRTNVTNLFNNDGDTGVADILEEYLDEITGTTGFLNQRAKSNGSLDSQIQSANDQIDRIEERLVVREARLRAQFTQLETLTAGFQQQQSSLAALGAGFAGI